MALWRFNPPDPGVGRDVVDPWRFSHFASEREEHFGCIPHVSVGPSRSLRACCLPQCFVVHAGVDPYPLSWWEGPKTFDPETFHTLYTRENFPEWPAGRWVMKRIGLATSEELSEPPFRFVTRYWHTDEFTYASSGPDSDLRVPLWNLAYNWGPRFSGGGGASVNFVGYGHNDDGWQVWIARDPDLAPTRLAVVWYAGYGNFAQSNQANPFLPNPWDVLRPAIFRSPVHDTSIVESILPEAVVVEPYYGNGSGYESHGGEFS